jgi:hypothetical protein
MCGLDLTARDTVSGPPPVRLVVQQLYKSGPDPSGGPVPARGGQTPRKPHVPRRLLHGSGPDPLRRSGAATWGPDLLRPRLLGSAAEVRTPYSPGKGSGPATWCPGGHSQAGPAVWPVAASLPWYASPTTALNATAARAEAAYGPPLTPRASPLTLR